MPTESTDGGHGWVSIHSSRSSRETLEDKYTDIKYVIQEEPTTVILPVDSSDLSEHCLTYYIRYIHKIGNKVCVLYVSEDYIKINNHAVVEKHEESGKCSCCSSKAKPPRVLRELSSSPGILKELEQQDKMSCHAFKRKVKKWFRTNGVLFEFHRLVSNNPPKAIVQFTKQMNGSIVVMGARRLSTFRSTFMASVSKKVLSLSEVPVLIVKKPVEKRASYTPIN